MSSLIHTQSARETQEFGGQFAATLKRGDVVGFYGEIGVGKTTVIQSIVHYLIGRPKTRITSPTFNYLNIYENEAMSLQICHFDLYRLESKEAFLEKGFGDYLHDNETICLIEWACIIAPLLPKNTLHVRMEHGIQCGVQPKDNETNRTIRCRQ